MISQMGQMKILMPCSSGSIYFIKETQTSENTNFKIKNSLYIQLYQLPMLNLNKNIDTTKVILNDPKKIKQERRKAYPQSEKAKVQAKEKDNKKKQLYNSSICFDNKRMEWQRKKKLVEQQTMNRLFSPHLLAISYGKYEPEKDQEQKQDQQDQQGKQEQNQQEQKQQEENCQDSGQDYNQSQEEEEEEYDQGLDQEQGEDQDQQQEQDQYQQQQKDQKQEQEQDQWKGGKNSLMLMFNKEKSLIGNLNGKLNSLRSYFGKNEKKYIRQHLDRPMTKLNRSDEEFILKILFKHKYISEQQTNLRISQIFMLLKQKHNKKCNQNQENPQIQNKAAEVQVVQQNQNKQENCLQNMRQSRCPQVQECSINIDDLLVSSFAFSEGEPLILPPPSRVQKCKNKFPHIHVSGIRNRNEDKNKNIRKRQRDHDDHLPSFKKLTDSVNQKDIEIEKTKENTGKKQCKDQKQKEQDKCQIQSDNDVKLMSFRQSTPINKNQSSKQQNTDNSNKPPEQQQKNDQLHQLIQNINLSQKASNPKLNRYKQPKPQQSPTAPVPSQQLPKIALKIMLQKIYVFKLVGKIGNGNMQCQLFYDSICKIVIRDCRVFLYVKGVGIVEIVQGIVGVDKFLGAIGMGSGGKCIE